MIESRSYAARVPCRGRRARGLKAVVRLGAAALLATAFVSSCACHPGRIRTLPEGGGSEPVASLESLEIGGTKQWILLRGQDRKLPVLLWLHGGPGAAQMPLARVTERLEEFFIVVHWDQRGAGKSNGRDFDPSTMSMDRFLDDAIELTEHLKSRFGREKIFVLGHSWGSHLGLSLAFRRPDSIAAFISVGQVVSTRDAHVLSRAWLESEILRPDEGKPGLTRAKAKDLARLEALGPAPYPNHRDFVEMAGMVGRYGGGMDWSFAKMAMTAISSPAYGFGDLGRWLSGARRGSGPMWPSYFEIDNRVAVPRLELPAYFISGEHDMNTPLALTREYFEGLDAPLGKELIVVRGAAHSPFLSKPEEFADILKAIRDVTWRNRP